MILSQREKAQLSGLPLRSSPLLFWVAFALVLAMWPGRLAVAAADSQMVEIDGQVDEPNHNYAWVVTNRHSSPIVYIEFPHYHADLFLAPRGWKTETFGLVGQPPSDQPNTCIARAEPPNPGIVRGATQEFTMRIALAGAESGRGSVKVGFADGKEITIGNVILPVPPPTGSKWMPLIGVAIIFVLWVVIRTLRERRRRRSEPPSERVPGTEA